MTVEVISNGVHLHKRRDGGSIFFCHRSSEICQQPVKRLGLVALSVHALSSAHLQHVILNAIKQSISLFVLLLDPLLPRSGKAGDPRVVAVDCVWSWNYVMMQQRGSCCLMLIQ